MGPTWGVEGGTTDIAGGSSRFSVAFDGSSFDKRGGAGEGPTNLGPEINPDAKTEAEVGSPYEGTIKLNGSNVGLDSVGDDEEIDLSALPLKAGGFAFRIAPCLGSKAI